jgi:hypothetical protein
MISIRVRISTGEVRVMDAYNPDRVVQLNTILVFSREFEGPGIEVIGSKMNGRQIGFYIIGVHRRQFYPLPWLSYRAELDVSSV